MIVTMGGKPVAGRASSVAVRVAGRFVVSLCVRRGGTVAAAGSATATAAVATVSVGGLLSTTGLGESLAKLASFAAATAGAGATFATGRGAGATDGDGGAFESVEAVEGAFESVEAVEGVEAVKTGAFDGATDATRAAGCPDGGGGAPVAAFVASRATWFATACFAARAAASFIALSLSSSVAAA